MLPQTAQDGLVSSSIQSAGQFNGELTHAAGQAVHRKA
jgi:hypothetical protein